MREFADSVAARPASCVLAWKKKLVVPKVIKPTLVHNKIHHICRHFNLKISQLCLKRVAPNSLATDKRVALGYRIELEFRNVSFSGERKTEYPEKDL